MPLKPLKEFGPYSEHQVWAAWQMHKDPFASPSVSVCSQARLEGSELSQALGLFQSVLLSTLPMDNFVIRWYIRLFFFFSSSSLFIITYLWGLAELTLRQPVRWMSDGTNQFWGPQTESLDMLEILEVLPKLCQSGWFVSLTETCLLLNQNGSLYSSWFRQYPQLDFEGD